MRSMATLSGARWCFGCVCLAILNATGASAERIPRGARITGTVELDGCNVQPRQLTLQADAMQLVLPDGRAPEAGRRASRRALVWRTRDPHVARFIILGLDPEKLYQLRIGYPRELCGKVFWRGPFQGFAVPGGEAVRIEGFAARTEVEVFDERADAWVAAAALDFDSADGGGTLRRFRWRSSVPGAVGGELQIAARAYATKGDFRTCEEPEAGLIYRAPVAIRGDAWTELPAIDFTQLLLPDGEPPPDDGRGVAALDGTVQALDLLTLRDIAMGAPLYVRVVPLTSAGPACDRRTQGVHGWALVARVRDLEDADVPPPAPGRIEPGAGHLYSPPYTGGPFKGYPAYGQQAFKIIAPHTLPGPCNVGLATWAIDPLGCAILDTGWTPGTQAPVGAWFYFAPMSSGGGGLSLSTFTNALSSLVTGTIDAVGFLIDEASKLYEDIKSAVKEVVLDAIEAVPLLGDLCKTNGDDCAKFVDAGMNAGLAAVGMPPSLPNFSVLKQQGLDYLASEIASQTGVPPYLSEKALEVANNAMEEMAAKRGGSDPKYNWVLPYLGFDPAYVEIVVKKNDAAPLPQNLVLLRSKTGLFRGGVLPIPSVFPASGELRIPMVVKPNLSAIPTPLCRYSRFTKSTSCVPFLPPGNAPLCQYQDYVPQQGLVWKNVDCTLQGAFAPVQLYYRDRWVQELDATSCTALWSASRVTGAFGFFLSTPPQELAMGTFASVEPSSVFWWSGWFGNGCAP